MEYRTSSDVNQPTNCRREEDYLFDSSHKQYIITKEVDTVMHVRGHVVAAYK